jgi:inorganic pyrophosphatase
VIDLPPFSSSGSLHVIIETPKGSLNKFTYDEELGLFKLGGGMPIGFVFPFDFGFVPSTTGGDGDPLDVLLLMDAPAFPGCLVYSRLLGAIEAEQTQAGKTDRNDRLIAVAEASRYDNECRSLEDLDAQRMTDIEHFFISYGAAKGKQVRPIARSTPERARILVEEGARQRTKEQGEMQSGRE